MKDSIGFKAPYFKGHCKVEVFNADGKLTKISEGDNVMLDEYKELLNGFAYAGIGSWITNCRLGRACAALPAVSLTPMGVADTAYKTLAEVSNKYVYLLSKPSYYTSGEPIFPNYETIVGYVDKSASALSVGDANAIQGLLSASSYGNDDQIVEICNWDTTHGVGTFDTVVHSITAPVFTGIAPAKVPHVYGYNRLRGPSKTVTAAGIPIQVTHARSKLICLDNLGARDRKYEYNTGTGLIDCTYLDDGSAGSSITLGGAALAFVPTMMTLRFDEVWRWYAFSNGVTITVKKYNTETNTWYTSGFSSAAAGVLQLQIYDTKLYILTDDNNISEYDLVSSSMGSGVNLDAGGLGGFLPAYTDFVIIPETANGEWIYFFDGTSAATLQSSCAHMGDEINFIDNTISESYTRHSFPIGATSGGAVFPLKYSENMGVVYGAGILGNINFATGTYDSQTVMLKADHGGIPRNIPFQWSDGFVFELDAPITKDNTETMRITYTWTIN